MEWYEFSFGIILIPFASQHILPLFVPYVRIEIEQKKNRFYSDKTAGWREGEERKSSSSSFPFNFSASSGNAFQPNSGEHTFVPLSFLLGSAQQKEEEIFYEAWWLCLLASAVVEWRNKNWWASSSFACSSPLFSVWKLGLMQKTLWGKIFWKPHQPSPQKPHRKRQKNFFLLSNCSLQLLPRFSSPLGWIFSQKPCEKNQGLKCGLRVIKFKGVWHCHEC